MNVGGPTYANGRKEPSVGVTAPTAMRPSQPEPTGHCWKPPSMMREPVVSVASACTSWSTTGCHVGMYVLAVALTSTRNGRGLVNAPPT